MAILLGIRISETFFNTKQGDEHLARLLAQCFVEDQRRHQATWRTKPM